MQEHAAVNASVGREVERRQVASRQADKGRAHNETDERVVERVGDDQTVESDAVCALVHGQNDKAKRVEDEADKGERRYEEQVERVHVPRGAEVE